MQRHHMVTGLCLLTTMLLLGPPATPCGGAVESIESAALILQVNTDPYSFDLIEKAGGAMLVSQRETLFCTAADCSDGFTALRAEAVTKTSSSLQADLVLGGTAGMGTIQFQFINPHSLLVQISSDSFTPAAVKEVFDDLGEHFYGIWEYPFSGGIDDRGVGRPFLGIKPEEIGVPNPPVDYANMRAPFYVTSKHYAV